MYEYESPVTVVSVNVILSPIVSISVKSPKVLKFNPIDVIEFAFPLFVSNIPLTLQFWGLVANCPSIQPQSFPAVPNDPDVPEEPDVPLP